MREAGSRTDGERYSKKLLPWLDGMVSADEEEFKKSGTPLYSSHMIDLSEETVEYNISTTAAYLKRSAPVRLAPFPFSMCNED